MTREVLMQRLKKSWQGSPAPVRRGAFVWCAAALWCAVFAPVAAADQTQSFSATGFTFQPFNTSLTGDKASPYPSNIAVAGLVGGVKKVTVTLNGFKTDDARYQEYLLVGPSGSTTDIMTDAPGPTNATGCTSGCAPVPIDLTLDDQATRQFDGCASNSPQGLTAGSYKTHPDMATAGICDETQTTTSGGERDFPAPAPAAPYGQTLSVHNGTDPNGTWSLYTFTDHDGQLTEQTGWTLTLTTPDPRLLTVALGGTGSGTVTGSGINCPGTCSKSYADGTQVTLTATPASGSTFTGWGGDCAGSGTGTCTTTMSAARSVTANFDPTNTNPGGGGGNPSNTFTFVGGKSCGQGCLKISLPGPGTVKAADNAAGGNARAAGAAYKKKPHKKRKPMIKPVTLAVGQAGIVQLHLTPSQAGNQVLKQKGKLTVTVRVTYTPPGGTPASHTANVTFKKKRKKK